MVGERAVAGWEGIRLFCSCFVRAGVERRYNATYYVSWESMTAFLKRGSSGAVLMCCERKIMKGWMSRVVNVRILVVSAKISKRGDKRLKNQTTIVYPHLDPLSSHPTPPTHLQDFSKSTLPPHTYLPALA